MDPCRTGSRGFGRAPSLRTAASRSNIHQQRPVLRSGCGIASARFALRCDRVVRVQKSQVGPDCRARRTFLACYSKLLKTPGKTQLSRLNTAMVAIAIASFAVGTVVRVLAAQNDLWFDEIWTLELLRERAHSLADVFNNIKHSNNHHLVSLWMWLVGQNASALVYRVPSVLASIGTVVVAGFIGMRRSWLEGCIAVILTSWSYLLIHYGTEARG